jgi:hypothetical protein
MDDDPLGAAKGIIRWSLVGLFIWFILYYFFWS